MANEIEINPFARDSAASMGDPGLDAFFKQGEYAPAPQVNEPTDLSQYLPTATQLAPPQTPMKGVDSQYSSLFQQAESKHNLPMGLLSTMGFHESSFNPNAVSPKGAAGVMGFMPNTAKEYNIDPHDTPAAIDAAGKKVAHLRDYYKGDLTKAVAAYNGGEGNLDKAIKKAGDNWLSAMPEETQGYVSKILSGGNQATGQAPQAEMYDIPLSDGSVLYAPVGMPKEEAIAKAQAQGVDAVGLKDVILADKSVLHVPDTMTDVEAVAYANEHNPGMNFALPKPKEPSLMEHLKSGFQDVGHTLETAVKAPFLSNEEQAQLVKQHQTQQAPSAADLEKVKQIYNDQGVLAAGKEVLSQAPGVIAGQMGNLGVVGGSALTGAAIGSAVPVVGTALGATLGAATGLFGMSAGSNIERQISEQVNKGEKVDPNLLLAYGAAIPQAALDIVGGPEAFLIKQFGKGAAEALVKQIVEDGLVKTFAKGVGKNLITEVPTEMGQEAIEMAQAKVPLTGEAAQKEFAQTAYQTALASPIGGPMNIIERNQINDAAPPPAPEPIPEGTPPLTPAPEGTPEGTPPLTPAPEGTPEGKIPEPKIRAEGDYEVPEGEHWVDTLGLVPSTKPTSKYQQLKQLDINDVDHHEYIKGILDTVARSPMKKDATAIEGLYQHMDDMMPHDANAQRVEFANTMGYTPIYTATRSGKSKVNIQSLTNEGVKTAIDNQDFTGTLDALGQSKNPIIQWIAERTKNISGVTIRSDVKAIRQVEMQKGVSKGTIGGFYRPGTEEVVMHPEHANSEWIVAHELLHANVSHTIDNPTTIQRPAVMGLMKLHDTVKNHPTLAKEYGLTNVHEFVSEGLSNPEFQYKLKKIKYENTTMWGKFTQTIADMLGAKRDNAFMELLTHVETLMPNKPETRTKGAARPVMAQEQGKPNANEVLKTATANVSHSTQPEVRQEGQGTAISSEGIRESRPETRQAEEEKDLTHLTFGDLGNRSNTLQDKIEEIEKRLDDQGMSWEDQDKHPELQKAYAERIAMDTQAAKKGYQGSKAILENVLRGLPEDSTYGSHKGLLRDAFSLTPDTTGGVYMMAKYTSQALNNKASTIKEMVKHIEPLLLAKRNPIADFHVTMGSNMSGLTQAGKDAIHSEAKQLAEESFDKIKDFFTDKVATPKEKQVSAVGNTGKISKANAEMNLMQITPDMQTHADTLADSGLVKTSDKSVLDAAKEGFKTLTDNTVSGIYTRLQTSFVDSSAGLRKALSSLDTFNLKGKLRADMLHSKNQQLLNVIHTSFKTGLLKFSSAGGLVATDNKNLALVNIFKRIDALKYADNRGTFFTMMRTLAGEQILRDDAVNRGKARDMLEAAKDLELFSNMIQDKVKYKETLDEAAALRKEANAILNKIGTEVSEGKGREKLVTDEQIAATKALMAKDARLGPIMADIYSLLNNSVDLWEQSGLVNAETADKWRENPAYLPLYKSMEDLLDDPAGYVQFLKSGAKSESKVHTLKGGTHAVNVGENLVKHLAFMAGAAAQNQLRKTAVGELWQVGGAYQTHPDDKQAVMYKHDGKKIYAHIDDPLTLEALETAMPSLPGWALHAREVTKVFRTVTLANPLYWYRQFIRDPIHANLVSQTGIVTPIGAIIAFAKILTKNSKTYNILEKQGVVGAVDSISDPEQFIKAVASKASVARKAGDKWMHIHEASDAATRVIVFEAAVKEAKARGITDKETIENFAAMRAREVINFSKTGNSQAIATIRATVPFFSAHLNSMDTLIRAATGMGLNKKEAARAKRIFVTRALTLATVSALWAMQLQDDDEYAKSPDWINSWMVPTGNKHNPFFRLPIPFEAGFFFKVLPELLVRLLSGTTTPKEARKDVTRAATQLLMPPIPIAQFFKPIAEVITDYDSFTGRHIESVADSKLTRQQRDSKASDLAKFIGKVVPISPNNIEHLGRGYLTELWATTTALAETMLHTGPAAPEKYLSEMPFLKGVLTKPDQDSAISRFYEVNKAASEIRNTIKHARKVGEKSVAEEMMTDPENAKMFRASTALTNIADRISTLRKNIERIKNTADDKLTPAEKKTRIQIIMRQISGAAEDGLRIAKQKGLDI